MLLCSKGAQDQHSHASSPPDPPRTQCSKQADSIPRNVPSASSEAVHQHPSAAERGHGHPAAHDTHRLQPAHPFPSHAANGVGVLTPHMLQPTHLSSSHAADGVGMPIPQTAADRSGGCNPLQEQRRHQPTEPWPSQLAGMKGPSQSPQGAASNPRGDGSHHAPTAQPNPLDIMFQHHEKPEGLGPSDAAPASPRKLTLGAWHSESRDSCQPTAIHSAAGAGNKPSAPPNSNGSGSFDAASGSALPRSTEDKKPAPLNPHGSDGFEAASGGSRSAADKQPAQPRSFASGGPGSASGSAEIRHEVHPASVCNPRGAVGEHGSDGESAAADSAAAEPASDGVATDTAPVRSPQGITGMQRDDDDGVGASRDTTFARSPQGSASMQRDDDAEVGDDSWLMQHTSQTEPGSADQKQTARPVQPSIALHLPKVTPQQPSMHRGSLGDGVHGMRHSIEQKQAASPAQPPVAQQRHHLARHLQWADQHASDCSSPPAAAQNQQQHQPQQQQQTVHSHGHDQQRPSMAAHHASMGADGFHHERHEHGHGQPQADWYPGWYAGFIGRNAPSAPASAATSNFQVGPNGAGVHKLHVDERPQLGTSAGNLQSDGDSPTTQQQPSSASKPMKAPSRHIAKVANWHQSGPVLMPYQMSHHMSHHPSDLDYAADQVVAHGEPHQHSSTSQLPSQRVLAVGRDLQPADNRTRPTCEPYQQAASHLGDSRQPCNEGFGDAETRGSNREHRKDAACSSPMAPFPPPMAEASLEPSLDHLMPQMAAYLEARKGAGGWSDTGNLPAHVSGTGSYQLDLEALSHCGLRSKHLWSFTGLKVLAVLPFLGFNSICTSSRRSHIPMLGASSSSSRIQRFCSV